MVTNPIIGSRALNWRVWLFAVGFAQFLVSIGFGNPLIIVTTWLGAMAVSALTLLGLGALAKKLEFNQNSRLVFVFACYLLTGFAISLVVNLLLIKFVLVPRVELGQLVSGTLVITWFLAITSAVVNDRHEFHQQLIRLQKVRAQLSAVTNWRTSTLNQTKESLVVRIANEIEAAKKRLSQVTSDLQLSDEIIRPLLEEISTLVVNFETDETKDATAIDTKRRLKNVIKVAALQQPKATLATALFIGTTWLATGLQMQSLWVSLVVTLISVALSFAALTAVRFTNVKRLALLAPLWVIAGAIAGVVPLLLAEISLAALAPMGIQTAVIMLSVSIALGYRLEGSKISERLQEENQQLDRAMVESSTQLRLFRERLHHYVHGDLQSALIALERKWKGKPADVHLALESLSKLVSGIQKRLEDEKPVELDETILELQTIWSGVMAISATVNENCRASLRNPATSAVLSELFIEVVTNAAKHNQATEVTLDLNRFDANTLSLTSTSLASIAFKPKTTSLNKGQGSQLFDEVCLRWSLNRDARTSTFSALIPTLETND